MIRIKIGTMPPLLRSIVRSALETQKDFAVTTAPPDPSASEFDLVDVMVVCSDRDSLDHIPVAALIGDSSPGIVAIGSAGDSASILRVTTERRRIDAAADLNDAVRRAASERQRAAN